MVYCQRMPKLACCCPSSGITNLQPRHVRPAQPSGGDWVSLLFSSHLKTEIKPNSETLWVSNTCLMDKVQKKKFTVHGMRTQGITLYVLSCVLLLRTALCALKCWVAVPLSRRTFFLSFLTHFLGVNAGVAPCSTSLQPSAACCGSP